MLAGPEPMGLGGAAGLPTQARYREYDVAPPPGMDGNRGGRRLVVNEQGNAHYTNTHYGDQLAANEMGHAFMSLGKLF